LKHRPAVSLVFALLVVLASARRARGDDGAADCADHAARAQKLRDATKLVESRELFLACARQECAATVRDACSDGLADVDRRVPSIVVNARDAGGQDIPTVRAFLDGTSLPDTASVTAVRVNPGKHTVRYEADGFVPMESRLVLREGEGVRVLAVTFRRPGEVGNRSSAEAPSSGVGRPSVLTYALGGTAIASLGLFAVAGLMGVSEYNKLERECSPKCSASELDDVRTKFVIADVALLVGLITGGGAVASVLFAGGPATERAKPR
jgi:hypothetical protein